jgi:hypothetical protein
MVRSQDTKYKLLVRTMGMKYGRAYRLKSIQKRESMVTSQ